MDLPLGSLPAEGTYSTSLPARVSAEGRGDNEPIADNSNASGRRDLQYVPSAGRDDPSGEFDSIEML